LLARRSDGLARGGAAPVANVWRRNAPMMRDAVTRQTLFLAEMSTDDR
jgi:hypothetical protein